MNRGTIAILLSACLYSQLPAIAPIDITFDNPGEWTTTITVAKNPPMQLTLKPKQKGVLRISDETVTISTTGIYNGKKTTISRSFTGYNTGQGTWTIHPNGYEKTITITKS